MHNDPCKIANSLRVCETLWLILIISWALFQ